MAYTKEKIKKGNDLMLFVKEGSTYKSVAFATNHTLTLSTETEDVQSKDSGYDGAVMAKRTTWEIQSENLYIESEFTALLEKMIGTDKYIDVVWGEAATNGTDTPELGFTHDDQTVVDGDAKKAWTPKATTYGGKALISSLTLNTNAGENATYSITLTGSGSFKQNA